MVKRPSERWWIVVVFSVGLPLWIVAATAKVFLDVVDEGWQEPSEQFVTFHNRRDGSNFVTTLRQLKRCVSEIEKGNRNIEI
jgi:hypothetical protein